MSDIAIRVQNLSKQYRIGEAQAQYKTLRESLVSTAKRLVPSNLKASTRVPETTIWALNDVSFEIHQGEVVGIIGRNGAGKSTLLKVLAHITTPTKGRVEIHGRVGSLLEVGTGFHNELTGRENIYLNGAILGMKKAEIERKFDEIVDFAEIEKFLDTPVKHYSSGMYMRLAFAVAAHLEPEILLVDEVLAVGDAQFQKKCLGKMGEVAVEGRTVLFVSHNMAAIKNLCIDCIYLQKGQLILLSNTENTINHYLTDIENTLSTVMLRDRTDRQGSGRVQVVNFYVSDLRGNQQIALKSGGDYMFVMEYVKKDTKNTFLNAIASIGITDTNNQFILLFRSNFTNQYLNISSEKGRIECKVMDLNLTQGNYKIVVFLSNGETETLDWVVDAAQITVEGGDYFGTGNIGLPTHCKVLTRTDWKIT